MRMKTAQIFELKGKMELIVVINSLFFPDPEQPMLSISIDGDFVTRPAFLQAYWKCLWKVNLLSIKTLKYLTSGLVEIISWLLLSLNLMSIMMTTHLWVSRTVSSFGTEPIVHHLAIDEAHGLIQGFLQVLYP